MSDLIVPEGAKPINPTPKKDGQERLKAGKQKSDKVHIKQGMPVASMNALGRPELLIFGLGDNDEVYVWDAKTRCWREN